MVRLSGIPDLGSVHGAFVGGTRLGGPSMVRLSGIPDLGSVYGVFVGGTRLWGSVHGVFVGGARAGYVAYTSLLSIAKTCYVVARVGAVRDCFFSLFAGIHCGDSN